MASYRKHIVTLLLLTFVSQAIASVNIGCQDQSMAMESDKQTINHAAMDHEMMDHSQHEMMDHSQHTTSPSSSAFIQATDDCCSDCECSLGSCTSSALAFNSEYSFLSSIYTLSASYGKSLANQVRITPFRPPIFR